MSSERKNITAPPDHWEAWQQEANRAGLSLSAWIGEQCNAALPKAAQRKLSDRQPAHRPKGAKTQHS